MKSYARLLCTTIGIAFLACLGGCSDPAVEPEGPHPTAADLVETEGGKADSFSFDPNRLISDDLFEDHDYMTLEEIQAFLEHNPYKMRSYLADYTQDGTSFAESVQAAAQKHRINPLILLVKIQVESSLIYRTDAPAQYVMDHAMGCGCLDVGPTCGRAPKGIYRQVDCAARLMRSYLTSLDQNGQTVSGWAVGRARSTSDQKSITPANRATAALYTYTPWVLRGQGGNWLFWNVMRKFSRSFLEERVNHRWIGGPCEDDMDCGYTGGTCLFAPESSPSPLGVCTFACERTCPDSGQPNTQITFCVDGAKMGAPDIGGLCTSVCSPMVAESCSAGFACQDVARFQEDDTTRSACVSVTGASGEDGQGAAPSENPPEEEPVPEPGGE